MIIIYSEATKPIIFWAKPFSLVLDGWFITICEYVSVNVQAAVLTETTSWDRSRLCSFQAHTYHEICIQRAESVHPDVDCNIGRFPWSTFKAKLFALKIYPSLLVLSLLFQIKSHNPLDFVWSYSMKEINAHKRAVRYKGRNPAVLITIVPDWIGQHDSDNNRITMARTNLYWFKVNRWL